MYIETGGIELDSNIIELLQEHGFTKCYDFLRASFTEDESVYLASHLDIAEKYNELVICYDKITGECFLTIDNVTSLIDINDVIVALEG